MWLLFWSIAAVLNALMDRLENESFHGSVFKDMDQHFWYKRESWDKAYRFMGYKFDAWHLGKSAMVICFAIALRLYEPLFDDLVYEMFLLWISWTIAHGLCYYYFFKARD